MTNQFHRRLLIPNNIFVPFYANHDINVYTELKLEHSMVNREFHEWLASHGVQIHNSRYFYAPPRIEYKLHKDISYANELNNEHSDCVKINIIYDSSGAKMSWYSMKPGKSPSVGTNRLGENIFVYDKVDCELLYSTDVNGYADMINGMYIHTMSNGNTPRQCYSMPLVFLGTQKRVAWEEAEIILAEYIVEG